MKLFFSFTIVFLWYQSYSQNIDYSSFKGKSVNLTYSKRVENSYVKFYSDDIETYRLDKLKSSNEIPNNLPEYIIIKRYNSVVNPEKTYIVFQHKITFKTDKTENAIIKYLVIDNKSKKTLECLSFSKAGEVWKQENSAIVSDIENFIRNVDKSQFKEFIKNEPTSSLKQIKNEFGPYNSNLSEIFLRFQKTKKTDSKKYTLLFDDLN